MRFIRSPAWDGFWIGGGSCVAVVLVVTSQFMPLYLHGGWIGWPLDWHSWSIGLIVRDANNIEIAALIFFIAAITVDTAHILSPMVLTWTDAQLRREALTRWRGFILAPVVAAVVILSLGAMTSLGWTDYVPGNHKMFYISYQIGNPFPVMILGYALWQIYHFGSQNFGLVMIYRRRMGRSGRRTLIRLLCLSVTAALMLPSYLVLFRVPQGYVPGVEFLREMPRWASFLLLGIVSVTHWLVALGLSLRVSKIRWHLWLPLLLALGTVGYIWQAAYPFGMMLRSAPWVVSLGIAVSVCHYLYDGILWKRGSTAMQAVLGDP